MRPRRTKRRRTRPPSLEADDDRAAALHEAALRLLTRREHAAGELAAKLAQRGFERETIEAEIGRLAEAGLQSDARFAELFAEQKVERGDGPVKIRAALAERGVDPDRIATALAPFEDQWCERARAALAARFGDDAPAGRAEHGRRARFLQSRGFPSAVVARALGRAADE